ncbi:hypothetical protein AHAS_Ahas18G0262400 [Arachis hypogaea]
MDGTMWMHHPRTNQMKDFLSDAHRFGQLKSIQTYFTFAVDPDFLENDIRAKPDLDALGSLGDEGVIMACGALLHWEDGKVATFYCSFMANLAMDITAVGTKGTLHVHDFIIPYEEKEASFYAA